MFKNENVNNHNKFILHEIDEIVKALKESYRNRDTKLVCELNESKDAYCIVIPGVPTDKGTDLKTADKLQAEMTAEVMEVGFRYGYFIAMDKMLDILIERLEKYKSKK